MAGAKDYKKRFSALDEVRKSIMDKLPFTGAQDQHVTSSPGVTEPHITISAQELLSDGKATFYGWLRKKGNDIISQKLMRWKHRYIILKDGCVYYFKSETSEKPCGAFSLSSYTRIHRADEMKTAELPWPFKLISKYGHMRTWFFSATNEQDMQHWMLNLQREMDAVNSCTRPQSVPGNTGPDIIDPDPAYNDGSELPMYHGMGDEEEHYYEDPDEDMAEEEDYIQAMEDRPRQAPVGAEAAGDAYLQFPDRPLPPTPSTKTAPFQHREPKSSPKTAFHRPPIPLPKDQSAPSKPPGGQRSPQKAMVPPHMKADASPKHQVKQKGKVPSPPWKELQNQRMASEPINISNPGRTAGRMEGQRETGVGRVKDIPTRERKESPQMVGALVAEMNRKFGESWQAGGAPKPRTPGRPVPAPKPGVAPKPALAPKPGHLPRQEEKMPVPSYKPQVEVEGIMEDRYEHEDEEEEPVEDPGIKRTPPEGNSFSKKNFNESPDSEVDNVMPVEVTDDIDVEKAESSLRSSQMDGKYFLRPSKQDKGKMVLVVFDYAGQKCRKFKLYGLGAQVFLHKGEPTFLTIADLLQHYQCNNLPISDGGDIRLTQPYQGH